MNMVTMADVDAINCQDCRQLSLSSTLNTQQTQKRQEQKAAISEIARWYEQVSTS
jgi:hypothetical protein